MSNRYFVNRMNTARMNNIGLGALVTSALIATTTFAITMTFKGGDDFEPDNPAVVVAIEAEEGAAEFSLRATLTPGESTWLEVPNGKPPAVEAPAATARADDVVVDESIAALPESMPSLLENLIIGVSPTDPGIVELQIENSPTDVSSLSEQQPQLNSELDGNANLDSVPNTDSNTDVNTDANIDANAVLVPPEIPIVDSEPPTSALTAERLEDILGVLSAGTPTSDRNEELTSASLAEAESTLVGPASTQDNLAAVSVEGQPSVEQSTQEQPRSNPDQIADTNAPNDQAIAQSAGQGDTFAELIQPRQGQDDVQDQQASESVEPNRENRRRNSDGEPRSQRGGNRRERGNQGRPHR